MRPRPWWINLFVRDKAAWVTFWGVIYHPKGIDPAQLPAYIAHEEIHVRQQRATFFPWWALKYLCSRSFRLDQEAEGFAAELKFYRLNKVEGAVMLRHFALALAGSSYWHCARTVEEAEAAIRRYWQP